MPMRSLTPIAYQMGRYMVEIPEARSRYAASLLDQLVVNVDRDIPSSHVEIRVVHGCCGGDGQFPLLLATIPRTRDVDAVQRVHDVVDWQIRRIVLGKALRLGHHLAVNETIFVVMVGTWRSLLLSSSGVKSPKTAVCDSSKITD
jgi:hypothetical protein